jgi:hypothetical protein
VTGLGGDLQGRAIAYELMAAVRERRIMLDADLAELYGVETGR